MSKREPTPAQARYRMRFSMHQVPDSAPKASFLSNRMALGKVMAFAAVFSMVLSSFGTATLAQAVAGSIKTTDTNCVTVNANTTYSEGDSVWVKASNFAANTTLSWTIIGQPGSSDPSTTVASGNQITDASGNVCFNTGYVILDGDQGVYKVNYGGKNDNYSIKSDVVVDEKVTICHQTEVAGVFEADEYDTLVEAQAHIAIHPGDYILENGDCGTVLGCDTDSTTENVPDCPDPCDEIDGNSLVARVVDCPPDVRRVVVTKSWEGYSEGNGPSNKGDITITVNGNDDSEECTYDGDEFECETTFVFGSTVNIDEEGIPAGWVVDPLSVGNVYPICDAENEEADCTAVVLNEYDGAQPCGSELVLNGDFEQPEVEDSAGWDIFQSGTEDLGWSAQWITANPDEDPAKIELHDGVLGEDHSTGSGNQYTELDSDYGGPDDGGTGENASVKIYQDLNTVVGGTYSVSFWTSPRPDRPAEDNQIRVQVGSVNAVVNNIAGGINWTEHTYTFVATSALTRISFSDEGPGNSYGGFLDDVSVKQDCLSDVKVCKQNTNQTYLPGWTVFLKDDLLETVEVPAISEASVSSIASLESGKSYILVASGTAQAGDGIEFDADYSYRDASSTTWTDSVSTYEYLTDQLLDLKVNGGFVNWDNDSTYNTSHEYILPFTGTGSPVTFGVNDTFASNNSGTLNVEIYPALVGTTGSDGCYTFENVEFGNYNLGEIMQSGWEYNSGDEGSVVIDGVADTFTLVNECTGNNCAVPCSENTLGWATNYQDVTQGPRNDGGEVAVTRQNPAEGLGPQNWDEGELDGDFYSLGFGGTITLTFSGYVVNNPGDDLVIHEATNGEGYPPERARIEVSQDGNSWYTLAEEAVNTFATDRTTSVDFGASGYSWIKFVKLTDTTHPEDFPIETFQADGYDLDAVQAILETCTPPEIEPCTEIDINVMSGTDTMFLGIKQGGVAPSDFNDESQYPGDDANAVIVGPTGYPGAWSAENDSDLDGAEWVSNDVTQPTSGGSGIYNGTEDSWRLFKHTFTIPAGADTITDPVFLHYSADNAVTVFFDGNEIATTGDMSGATSGTQHFATASDIELPDLTAGTHTLEFAVRNWAFEGQDNPTGVIFKLDTVSYDCDNTPPCEEFNPDLQPGLLINLVNVVDALITRGVCYSISGNVYHDENNNGNFDLDGENPDDGLASWKVYIDEDDSDTLNGTEQSITTDVNGAYTLAGLAAGCYTIREELIGSGWLHGIEPVGNEYQVGIGGVICPLVTTNFANNATDIDFGNILNDQGGCTSNCGGGGGGTQGSNTRKPQVAGDTTTIPYIAPDPLQPQVAGASTTLPVTGNKLPSVWALLALMSAIILPASIAMKMKEAAIQD